MCLQQQNLDWHFVERKFVAVKQTLVKTYSVLRGIIRPHLTVTIMLYPNLGWWFGVAVTRWS